MILDCNSWWLLGFSEWTHLRTLGFHLFHPFYSDPIPTNSLCRRVAALFKCDDRISSSSFILNYHLWRHSSYLYANVTVHVCLIGVGVAISNSIFYPLWRSSRQKVLTFFNYYFPFASFLPSFLPLGLMIKYLWDNAWAYGCRDWGKVF